MIETLTQIDRRELLELARLMKWTYERRRPAELAGNWVELDRFDDDDPKEGSGVNASAFADDRGLVVMFEGQKFWRRSDAKAILRRRLRHAYHPAAADYVRQLQRLHPERQLIVGGHSGGAGQAAQVAKLLGVKHWAVGFNGGRSAIRTNADSNNGNLISVEIEGDRWGDSSEGPPLAGLVERLPFPEGMKLTLLDKLLGRTHSINVIIEALRRRLGE